MALLNSGVLSDGTQIQSHKSINFPPDLPVNAMVTIPISFAVFTAETMLLLSPLVVIE